MYLFYFGFGSEAGGGSLCFCDRREECEDVCSLDENLSVRRPIFFRCVRGKVGRSLLLLVETVF